MTPIKHFGSSGDLGDVILSLPIVQQLGGKHFYWLYNRPFTKDIESRFHLIAPLLMAQPYIECVGVSNGKGVDYDLAEFRKHYIPTRTLLDSHSEYATRRYGLTRVRGENPWLTVTPESGLQQRVVIARSPRYHNPYFPWAMIVKHYGPALLFIGLPEEHATFCREFGNVEYRPTLDLLDSAQVIAGSALFIGNQSSPNALAEGLKHPRIQETNLRVPDCIYPGGGPVQHVADGTVNLPAVGGAGPLVISSSFSPFREMDTMTTPPGGWQYPGCTTHSSFNALRSEVVGKERISVAEAAKAIYTYNCGRVPTFFRSQDRDGLLTTFRKAQQNAA